MNRDVNDISCHFILRHEDNIPILKLEAHCYYFSLLQVKPELLLPL